MRLTHGLVFAVIAFLLAACSGQDSSSSLTTDPGDQVKLIVTLSAQTDTIPEATSKPLTARVTDVTGFVRPATITWSTSDPNVATVAAGLVTGIAQGVASIIATTVGAADTAVIVVTENGVTLDVQPSEVEVAAGDTVDFVATLRTRSGDIIPAGSFKWDASDTVAASFVNAGILHAKREGELAVTAEAMMRRGGSVVRIFRSPVGSVTLSPSSASIYRDQTVQFEARLRDQNGRLIDRDVTWGSSDYSKARVNQDGLVTGVAVGTVVITATSESKTASATVAIMSPPARTVELELPSSTLSVGTEMQATVRAMDASGETIVGKTIAYQSSHPSIATVTSAGKVRGVADGSVTISAIVDGVIGRRGLTVRGAQASSIQITPASPAITVGQASQLVAQVLDQNGTQLTGQAVVWSSSNPSSAVVLASGIVQGIAPGSSVVTATSGGVSASTTVLVLNTPVASVRVSPTSLSLTAGQQGSAAAVALDANQGVLAGRIVTWSSQNPTVASVTNAGVVTAIASGTTTLVATVEGKSGSLPVTVASAPQAGVASVAINLGTSALNVGQQSQATATVTDASGKVLTGRAVDWNSLDHQIASVSESGLVTAKGAGTVAIVATVEGKSGSASLTVTAPPPAPISRIEIEAPTQSLGVGQQVQCQIKLFDASGNSLSTAGRTITYRSDNSAIISVSSVGLVKGVGNGATQMRVTIGTVTAAETFTVAGTSTTPTVASITVTPPTSSLTVGQTTQAAAIAKNQEGDAIPGTTFAWSTSNTNVATVSPSGLVTAKGAGSATIYALASGKTGSMTVTVTAPTTTNVVASVSVSLSPSSITVGGTSQATAVARNASGAIITGKTPTWSLGGSLLGSISSSGLISGLLAGVLPVTATIDGVSGSANLTLTATVTPPPTPSTPPSGAAATILSILGQTKTVTENAATGGVFAKYDQTFTQYLPATSTDADWMNNYYDRAAVFYARYARTGDATFLTRAQTLALAYRKNYLEASSYKPSAHWSQVRGLELHYRLTGDTLSRRAVVASYALSLDPHIALGYLDNTQHDHADNRVQARILQAALSSYRMGASYGSFTAAGWPAKLRDILNRILSTQKADGSYAWRSNCGGQLNYMVGMLNDVLIEYYRDFEQDSRIPSSIERANEYMWNTQWRAADQAFNYASVTCNPNPAGEMVGGPSPTGDLSGLNIASFGWLYQHTGNAKWKTRGDEIMAGIVSSRWASAYGGSKQFNQAFSEAYRYLAWR